MADPLRARHALERNSKQNVRVEEHPLGHKCWVLNRYWLVADPDDYGFTPHAKNDGYWEAWITVWMLRALPGKAFIDVGANMGYYTLLALSEGCPTQAFEPQPKLHQLVTASIHENGWGDAAAVHQIAAGALEGTAVFTVPNHHGMLATYAYNVRSRDYFDTDYDTYEVEIWPLDFLVDWQPELPLLIKIDVEGAEPHTWAGMQSLLRRPYPTTVLLEYRADRYQDPVGFANALLASGLVSYIDATGNEVPVSSPDILTKQPDMDWMVVVRPRPTDG